MEKRTMKFNLQKKNGLKYSKNYKSSTLPWKIEIRQRNREEGKKRVRNVERSTVCTKKSRRLNCLKSLNFVH